MSETKGTALEVLSLTTEIAERIGRHLSRMERSAQKVNGYSMAVNPDGTVTNLRTPRSAKPRSPSSCECGRSREQAMTNEIRPALSAEEWAGRHAKRALRVFLDARGGITVAGDSGGAGTHDPATLHAIIAIANASLPDDDPRKVTWEIHDAIMWAISDYESEAGFMDETQQREHAAMLRGLAIIASLLPPREEG